MLQDFHSVTFLLVEVTANIREKCGHFSHYFSHGRKPIFTPAGVGVIKPTFCYFSLIFPPKSNIRFLF